MRIYAAVDGGMTDNPRYALYQSEYEALAANKAADPKTMTVTLAGKCCESGDLLGEGMPVQQLESGDIVAVLSTNATTVRWPPATAACAARPWCWCRRRFP